MKKIIKIYLQNYQTGSEVCIFEFHLLHILLQLTSHLPEKTRPQFSLWAYISDTFIKHKKKKFQRLLPHPGNNYCFFKSKLFHLTALLCN